MQRTPSKALASAGGRKMPTQSPPFRRTLGHIIPQCWAARHAAPNVRIHAAPAPPGQSLGCTRWTPPSSGLITGSVSANNASATGAFGPYRALRRGRGGGPATTRESVPPVRLSGSGAVRSIIQPGMCEKSELCSGKDAPVRRALTPHFHHRVPQGGIERPRVQEDRSSSHQAPSRHRLAPYADAVHTSERCRCGSRKTGASLRQFLPHGRSDGVGRMTTSGGGPSCVHS